MCGIVGIINGTKNRNADGRISGYLRDAIVANTLRGFDSTGIVQASKNPKHLVYTEKATVDGLGFLRIKKNETFIRDADDTAFTFVHNRAATRGAVTEENAHPFQHTNDNGDWMIGVHNGTLTGWTSSDEFKVDSDWALSQIAYDGADAFEKFDGAYAFVWYGEREGVKVINMARNSQRPMFVAYVKDTNRMLFASEHLMMVWLADRNNLKLDDEIIDIQPGMLYQFDTDNPRIFKKSKLPFYKAKSRQELLFEEMDRIFSSIRKDAKPVSPLPMTAPVVVLPPTKNNKKKDKQAAKQNARKGNYVTPEEARMAKVLELNGQVVDMVLEQHLVKDKEAWGLAEIGKDYYTCIIRDVDDKTYDTWRSGGVVMAKVVGAQKYTHNNYTEYALILSRNVKVENEDLGEAISQNINRFMETRDESGSIH